MLMRFEAGMNGGGSLEKNIRKWRYVLFQNNGFNYKKIKSVWKISSILNVLYNKKIYSSKWNNLIINFKKIVKV